MYTTIAAIAEKPYRIIASIVFCFSCSFSSEKELYVRPACPKYEATILLVAVNAEIRNHPIEVVGRKLRAYMTAMKPIL